MSWPGTGVHAHWTKYHTRYYQIAGSVIGYGIKHAPCEPGQWIRDNLSPGKLNFGDGFYIDRSVTGNLCQIIPKKDHKWIQNAFLKGPDVRICIFSTRPDARIYRHAK